MLRFVHATKSMCPFSKSTFYSFQMFRQNNSLQNGHPATQFKPPRRGWHSNLDLSLLDEEDANIIAPGCVWISVLNPTKFISFTIDEQRSLKMQVAKKIALSIAPKCKCFELNIQIVLFRDSLLFSVSVSRQRSKSSSLEVLINRLDNFEYRIAQNWLSCRKLQRVLSSSAFFHLHWLISPGG